MAPAADDPVRRDEPAPSAPDPDGVPGRDDLLAHLPFRLDRFQIEALDALDRGEHVVVAAPTGSGKTVVADYAVDVALGRGRRAYYTTPIKALSNQKYRDLRARLGDERVGLLTGDVAIRGDADVVVMTTEVLRNMIYAGAATLGEIDAVVLDEVHFLQDPYRGPVWEEVIIQVPDHVRLICLSATVSNAEQLADWISTVRGPTTAVVEDRRPVPLHQQYAVADRVDHRVRLLPILTSGRPNPEGFGFDRDPRAERSFRQRRYATPGRVEIVRALDRRGLLPAIVFVFSRNQCDEAAAACADAGLSFTTGDQRRRIREIVADRLSVLDPTDLAVLGARRFRDQLEAGIAAHHAGLVPAFKDVVETCFAEGLLRVVFATETLAVGVNLPARTVVIEKLTKYTGDRHERLSPAQFTQLTGRAGRRGIDVEGDAIVAWSPFVPFAEVAQLASSRSFHLRSAFRPTYNLAANLVGRHDEATARRFVERSFAQFQSDREVVRVQARLDRLRSELEERRAAAESPFGDLDDYRRTRLAPTSDGRDPVELALAALRPGDVVHVDHRKHRAPGVVVATANRRAGTRITVVMPSGAPVRLRGDAFAAPPSAVGRIELPDPVNPDRPEFRREVAGRLRTAEVSAPGRTHRTDTDPGRHPVEDDPDLQRRVRAAERVDVLERDIASTERRAHQHRHSLGDALERVLDLLERRGHLDRRAWTLTDAGRMLARTFHESDLLVVEAVRAGLFDGLEPADLAALASMFVYEHRSPQDPPPPWYPTDELRRRGDALLAMSAALARDEAEADLPVHRTPDPGFVAIAHGWVAGGSLAEVIEDELTGGDLVRTMRQLIDLLGQLANVAPEEATRRAARRARESAARDVVVDRADPAPEAPPGAAPRSRA